MRTPSSPSTTQSLLSDTDRRPASYGTVSCKDTSFTTVYEKGVPFSCSIYTNGDDSVSFSPQPPRRRRWCLGALAVGFAALMGVVGAYVTVPLLFMASTDNAPTCPALLAQAPAANGMSVIELDVISLMDLNEEPPVSRSVPNARTNWMEANMDRLKNKTLLEITLPGTHDSAAYEFIGNSLYAVNWVVSQLARAASLLHLPLEKLIVDWSKAQDRTVRDQLMEGIRYIDLRIVWDGKDWRTFHGITGALVSDLLDEVLDFLNTHTQEVVVLEVSIYAGSPGGDACALAKLLQDKFGTLLVPQMGDFQDLRIERLVAANQRLVCVVGPEKYFGSDFEYLWGAYAIRNTFANTPDLAVMERYNRERAEEFSQWKSTASLYKISWTLTPSVATIVSSLWPRASSLWPRAAVKNLRTLALQANPRLASFVETLAQAGERPGHILVVDYWEELSHVVELAMAVSLS